MAACTVFTIDTCPFCSRAKGLLRKRNVEYIEINLSEYPELRQNMLSLTKRTSVPQIFFTGTHIGGATDLEELDKEGKLLTRFEEAKSKEVEEETLKLLKAPDYSPKPKAVLEPVPSRKFSAFTKSSDKTDKESATVTFSAPEVVSKLTNSFGNKKFLGEELLKWVQSTFATTTEGTRAMDMVQELFESGVITFVCKENSISELRKAERFLHTRLQLFKNENKYCLNHLRHWKHEKRPANAIALSLKVHLDSILKKYRDDSGLVNYLQASRDPLFFEFEEAVCELQGVVIHELPINTRLAFLINVYNLLTLHAFTKVGIPSSTLERGDFFGLYGYDLGGDFYSFNAIENGLLRGNKLPPYQRKKTIHLGDPRAKGILPELHPEIHAALNCGAKSCPPVKAFSEDGVLEEIEIAARAFFEDDSNCSVDIDSGTVKLTRIVNWYMSDFGRSNEEVLKNIRKWLDDVKGAKLDTLLSSKKPVSISYNKYDWSTDQKESVKFIRRGLLSIFLDFVR